MEKEELEVLIEIRDFFRRHKQEIAKELGESDNALREALKEHPNFIEQNKADLAASLQRTIIEILMDKFGKAIKATGIKTIAIGGGVSANSGMRAAVEDFARRHRLKAFIPKRVFTTDNAAMIAIAGHYKFLDKDFCDITAPPFQRVII